MSTFAVVSDPHVTVANPDTGWFKPSVDGEPTLYGHSVELLETVIDEINALPDVDFVLVPGDLTKDSEPYNHDRARELLTRFRKPVFCVSGNHDQPRPPAMRPPELLDPSVKPVTLADIPRLYGDFGFDDPLRTAYSCDPTPDIHLVGLCSPKPGEDRGHIAADVLAWLDEDLGRQRDLERETIVMLHHSIIDHVPHESINPSFSWFHVENALELKAMLRRHGVRITLTGHLHIQDIKEEDGLYNIVTSSIAGYPHAYRVFDLRGEEIDIRSKKLTAIPSVPDLQGFSLDCTSRAFEGIIGHVLMAPPFGYGPERAALTAAKLRDWWPTVAVGDEEFHYTEEMLGDAALAAYVNSFSDRPPPDNDLTIALPRRRR